MYELNGGDQQEYEAVGFDTSPVNQWLGLEGRD